MDFFARQDRARAQTGQLLGLFIFSVGVVVTAITLVLVLVIGSNFRDPDVLIGSSEWWLANSKLMAMCAVGVLGVVLAGTMFKLLVLQGGGAVVARSMGGDLVDANTTDPLQRRLLNVVEEMAMAWACRCPRSTCSLASRPSMRSRPATRRRTRPSRSPAARSKSWTAPSCRA